MPTENPRVNVTFDPAVYDQLRRAAKLQGTSMAGLIRDLVESVMPMLDRMITLGEALERAPQEIRDSLREASERAEPEIMQQLEAASGDYEKLMHLAEQLAGIAQEVENGDENGQTPGSVITGVTP